jgi:hypothetical protein
VGDVVRRFLDVRLDGVALHAESIERSSHAYRLDFFAPKAQANAGELFAPAFAGGGQ